MREGAEGGKVRRVVVKLPIQLFRMLEYLRKKYGLSYSETVRLALFFFGNYLSNVMPEEARQFFIVLRAFFAKFEGFTFDESKRPWED